MYASRLKGLGPVSVKEVQNLLVVGVDTVSVVASAKKAGYNVYVADYFGDMDLRGLCSDFEAVIEQRAGKSCGNILSNFKPEKFLEMAKNLRKLHSIDGILLSSGLEDCFEILDELNSLAPIIGNPPEVFRNVREKPKFFAELEELGLPYPETKFAKDVSEAEHAASEIGYPFIIKPLNGFGGTFIRLIRNRQEMEKVFSVISKASENVIVQEYVEGVNASISILAVESDVKVLSVNEQLLGLRCVFQSEPFGYCGNIVPLKVSSSVFENCRLIAEKIAFHFGLKGSNGIDIVIPENGKPHVIEVNPRFQGTLRCVERVFGINLVESHIKACLYGELPETRELSKFCTRLVLYTPKRVFAPDLTGFKELWDIPLPNSILEQGEPLCSILAEGKNRSNSFQKACRSAKSVYSLLREA